MLKNDFIFFENEFKNYEQILLKYKNNNSDVFVDPNFHPSMHINETIKDFNIFDEKIEWKRIDTIYPNPLFMKTLINQDYIAQGGIGDCYFISALSRIAKQPHLVKPLFEIMLPNKILGKVEDSINIKCGAVVIYFQAFGRRTPVLIDTLIPTLDGKPIFSSLIDDTRSGWFCLVEKAFAKLNGSYSNIEKGLYCDSIYSLYGYRNVILPSSKHSLYKEREFYAKKIVKYERFGCIMDSTIIPSLLFDLTLDDVESKGLHEEHSYLLLKTTRVGESLFFLLRNPWGKYVWKGDYSKNSPLWTQELQDRLGRNYTNGEFWMIDNDFFRYFTIVNVSKPFNQILER